MLTLLCAALVFTVGRGTDDKSFRTMSVRVGEDVSLTCSRQNIPSIAGTLFWIKVVAGNVPEVLGATYTFDSANVNTTPRFTAKQEPGQFVLHITKTELSDTALYYCEQVVELRTTFLNKTFLKVEGPETNITAIIQVPAAGPVRPGDLMNLQCSVLSDSEKKTCPGDHRVYWFRAASDQSHPTDFYTCGNSNDCEKSPEACSPQKCVYNLTKSNVSSSDAETYYCAVATCGKILFGTGEKVDIEDKMRSFGGCQMSNTILFLLCSALAISLIVIALLIYTIKKRKCKCCNAAAVLQADVASTTGDQERQDREEDSLVYSVPDFTRRKAGRSESRGVNTAESEAIYTCVRVSEEG